MANHLANRRQFLKKASAFSAGLFLCPNQLLSQATTADKNVTVSGIEVATVSVTNRTNWIIVTLLGSNGIKGLGEASVGRRTEIDELGEFYSLINGKSPFEIQRYRQLGWTKASTGSRTIATAFSAIEQALWDLISKSLNVPFYDLVGGKLNEALPVYANINRATSQRDPVGFAENAVSAVNSGFKAIKAAPFDGFPPLDSEAEEINSARKLGVECIYAMREAVGEDIAIKIDAHSFFDTDLAISVAHELDTANLSWFEEPVSPTQTENTRIIHDTIPQKIVGGVWEAIKISAFAEAHGIMVAPHNPSGPVSTAASAALCAAIPNFDVLEYQWGEKPWRKRLAKPMETFVDGSIIPSDLPGFGIEIDDRVFQAHRI